MPTGQIIMHENFLISEVIAKPPDHAKFCSGG